MPERARPPSETLRRYAHFARDRSGATMALFGAVLPGLLVAGGAAVDFGMMVTKRTTLQNVADTAALAAAREFRLGNASLETTQKIAERYAQGALESAGAKGVIDVKADLQNRTVTVMINDKLPMLVMHMFGSKLAHVAAKATAKVVGGSPVCVIGLETNASGTVEMDKSARLEAPDCAVYSNSTKPNGLVARNNATIRASFICSAGGKSSPGPGSFSPTPQTDCPIFSDPLASRQPPAAGACVMTNAEIKTSTSLFPGTYCGGLKITNGASVTMSPGIYVIKDGPFTVDSKAILSGANTGFYFTGAGARIDFKAASTIALTAPKDGQMAGLLFFEDRAAPLNQTHEISSDKAGILLGTIYLPNGRLHVAATKPVAQDSAYTIVVARRFTLSEGPTMVMNTKYSSTDIPVPPGVGPSANGPKLID